MSRTQHDSALAGLCREIKNLKVPEWFGDEADLKKECFDAFEDEGAIGFRNLGNIRERKGELVGLIEFFPYGQRRTLGVHPLWKAAFVVDLYRIFIFDKFISPLASDTLPHTTNYHWKKDQIENVQYEEPLLNLIECWKAWLSARGFLRTRQAFPKVLTDEDREKGRQKEWERRSKVGQRVSGAVQLITQVAAEGRAEVDKVLLNLMNVAENVESRAALRQMTIDNARVEIKEIRKEITEIKALLLALCKSVVNEGGQQFTEGGERVHLATRCRLCNKEETMGPNHDHCSKCQPTLLMLESTVTPLSTVTPALL